MGRFGEGWLSTPVPTFYPIRAEILGERVRQKMEAAARKDVYLRGDAGVNRVEVTEVTDMLKAAGVEHVGIVTKGPGER